MNTTATPAANVTPGSGTAGAAAGDGATPKTVTVEDLEKVVTKLNSDIRAELGRELKGLREAVGSAGSKPPPDAHATTETPTEKTLRDRIASLEEREARQQNGAVRLSLRDALVQAGASPTLAEMAVPAIMESEGAQFRAVPNRLGGYDVAFGEGLAIAAWTSNFMASDRGKSLIAPTAAPGLGLPGGSRASGSSSGKRQVPRSMISKLTVEDEKDLQSGMIEFVDG